MISKKRYDLKEPIQAGGEEITFLEMRKPIAKDLHKFPAQMKSLGEMLPFVAHLCAVPTSTIEQLGLEDTMNLVEVIMDFLPDSLKTGIQS
jgi:hypothetical protein